MNNNIKQEMEKIKIPDELHLRSEQGVDLASEEKQPKRKKYKKPGIIAAIVLLASIGMFAILNNEVFNNSVSNQEMSMVKEGGGVMLPAIELPEDVSTADMIGLIVYDQKIYTQTTTEINPKDAAVLLGEKLGTTKGNIDEWSEQESYQEALASSIGKTDVYSVIGYDKDFRIMAYEEREGTVYAEFYESLNGITVYDGTDVFGKLKMDGNVTNAQYRTFRDWNLNQDNYQDIDNLEIVRSFIKNLSETEPFLRSNNSDPISESRNEEAFREVTIHLTDGSRVRLILLKDGYIYYGYTGVYFKMKESKFSAMWNQLS